MERNQNLNTGGRLNLLTNHNFIITRNLRLTFHYQKTTILANPYYAHGDSFDSKFDYPSELILKRPTAIQRRIILHKYVFNKINNYYLLVNNDIPNPNITDQVFLNQSIIKELNESYVFTHEELLKLFNWEIPPSNKKYKLARKTGFCVFFQIQENLWGNYKANTTRHTNQAINEAEGVINKYRFAQNEDLIRNLFNPKYDLKSCIKAFANYLYCSKYSLWIFNPDTNYFTCEVSSEYYNTDYLDQIESPLFKFYNSNKIYDKGKPSQKLINYDVLQDMKTMNRIRLDLGQGITGILSFYSIKDDFTLLKRTYLQIKNFIEMKYSQNSNERLISLKRIETYFSERFKPSKFQIFLEGLCREICKEMSFEECSIFIFKHQTLKPVASYISDKSQMRERNTAPSIINKNFDANIIKNEWLNFSYKSDQDNNSKHKEHLQNWIEIALRSESTVIGLLQLKNKLFRNHKSKHSGRVVSFKSIDFKILEVICSSLSNAISTVDLFNQNRKQLNESRRINKEQNRVGPS